MRILALVRLASSHLNRTGREPKEIRVGSRMYEGLLGELTERRTFIADLGTLRLFGIRIIEDQRCRRGVACVVPYTT